MLLTYNQIIQLSREFSQAHYKLKNFGNGADFDIVLSDQENPYRYPIMWMEDLPMPLEQGLETFSFKISFLAPVEELDERDTSLMSTNVNEVKSDMLQCAKDFLAYWKQDHTYSTLRVESNAPRITAEGVTPDLLSGAQIDITFKQAFNYNKCAIPMSDVTPPADSCGPATYKNSDATFTQSINSGAIFTSDDITITVNGTPYVYPSNTDQTITIPIVTPINTATLFNTGAVTSYQLNDDGDKQFGRGTGMLLLDGVASDYPANTLNRFTDDLGTQIYANGTIIDWSTWNQVNGDVLWYHQTLETNKSLTDQIGGQPYTRNALADWWVCNKRQMDNVWNDEIFRDPFNYPPFNISITTITDRMWTSWRESATIGRYYFETGSNIASQATLYKALLSRLGNVSELTL